MYLRREVGAELALEPDTAYRVPFTVAFASDAPSDCAGIGGAPGESVWLTVGAAAEEPVPFTDDGDTRLLVDFEGRTSLYYDRIEVMFTPAA